MLCFIQFDYCSNRLDTQLQLLHQLHKCNTIQRIDKRLSIQTRYRQGRSVAVEECLLRILDDAVLCGLRQTRRENKKIAQSSRCCCFTMTTNRREARDETVTSVDACEQGKERASGRRWYVLYVCVALAPALPSAPTGVGPFAICVAFACCCNCPFAHA